MSEDLKKHLDEQEEKFIRGDKEKIVRVGGVISIGFKKREKPIPEFEKLSQAVEELKKEILETWFGKFMFWILDRLSQVINWVRRTVKRWLN